jgi:hypothetical protein
MQTVSSSSRWCACFVGVLVEAMAKAPLQVQEKMDLGFTNVQSFERACDSLPTPSKHSFECINVELPGDKLDGEGRPLVEHMELWRRNILDCVRDLIGNPAFRDVMAYAPHRAFRELEALRQIFDQAWTAEWWWDMQVSFAFPAT